jgi:hypothetical protein
MRMLLVMQSLQQLTVVTLLCCTMCCQHCALQQTQDVHADQDQAVAATATTAATARADALQSEVQQLRRQFDLERQRTEHLQAVNIALQQQLDAADTDRFRFVRDYILLCMLLILDKKHTNMYAAVRMHSSVWHVCQGVLSKC